MKNLLNKQEIRKNKRKNVLMIFYKNQGLQLSILTLRTDDLVQEQNDDNKNRDHRPGQLDLGASVYLRRLAVVLRIALPETDHHVQPKRADHKKNHTGDLHHEKRQMMDHLRRAGVRVEDGRRLMDDSVSGQAPCLGAAQQEQQRISGWPGPFASQRAFKHS